MHAVRAIVHSSFRGYRSFRGRQKSAWDSPAVRETPMIQRNMPIVSLDDNENDEYDHDMYESDFSTVGEYHKMHQAELEQQKLDLKYQIVKRQYFKSEEPAMLTWGEKEQIRLLHEKDPEEWTPEKLSESFPASSEAISRIIRAKWQPKSTKVIENYEKKVIDNWKLFRAGKLPLDDKLREHLKKFNSRNVKITDRETMKKFVKPKPHFPKPKSVVFSDIIRSSLDKDEAKKDRGERKNVPSESTKELSEGNCLFVEAEDEIIKRMKQKSFFTYGEFLKKHVEAVNEKEMTPVDRVIVDEYKRRNSEAYKKDSLLLRSQSAVGIFKNEETKENEEKRPAIVGASCTEEISQNALSTIIDENSMGTGIIARQKKEATLTDYPEVIKIPRRKYNFNVTFRIEDRYYDADGRFLYRVPGLFS